MLYAVAVAVRAALLAFGARLDAGELRYTDVDHDVLSDAARLVASGRSPYERSTYRYTPLLAHLLAPAASFPLWPKLLFCAGDLVAGRLIGLALGGRSRLAEAAWLFSPLTAVISTRGSAESPVSVCLLGVVLLANSRPNIAGALLGLAAHWRIYPLVYAAPLARGAWEAARREGRGRAASFGRVAAPALAAALSFLLLGAGCWLAYGEPFLQEAFLYHLGRRDPRHSFSPAWLPAALSLGSPGGGSPGGVGGHEGGPGTRSRTELALSTCQPALVLLVGWARASDLPRALFLQTLSFVALNRVSTSQYFSWYWIFLPLLIPRLVAAPAAARARAAAGAALWVAAQALWLALAYLLEFRGVPTHLALELASVLFTLSQLNLVVAVDAALGGASGATDAGAAAPPRAPMEGLTRPRPGGVAGVVPPQRRSARVAWAE